ncbi:MAG TPA: hypothetical protein VEY11_16160 [Pyrinomonadaceae bacterium]|nr:hypothetical protein [Pyrinomonadaceae bacterium]
MWEFIELATLYYRVWWLSIKTGDETSADGAATRKFNEFRRRRIDLDILVYSPCFFDHDRRFRLLVHKTTGDTDANFSMRPGARPRGH